MNKFQVKYTQWLENLTIGLLLLTILNVFIDVVLRYVFNDPFIALQELEWHLFSTLFLIGIAYTLQADAHVRVDIFYTKFSPKKQALINLIGLVIFVLPISVLIAYYGFDFAYQAFELGEKSADPGGLTQRFLIKSMISVSSILVIISASIFAKHHYQILKS